jgi:H+-transporting ATPase
LNKRTEGTIKDTRTGVEFKTTKGAPHVILGLLDADDHGVRDAVEGDVARLGAMGIRSLAARFSNETGKWTMQGVLNFLDPRNPHTKQTIEEANKDGVQVKMTTGDRLLIAVITVLQLGMGDRIFATQTLSMLDPETKTKPKHLSKTRMAAYGFAQVFS